MFSHSSAGSLFHIGCFIIIFLPCFCVSGFIVAALHSNEERILMTDNGLRIMGDATAAWVSRRRNPLGRLSYGASYWVKNGGEIVTILY
jgi:hypothetical protein